MQLEKISGCNDIKKLNLIEKKELSQEIRDFLIKAVAKTGGHLASNLGVVELTIALESVFDVTKDKIIWDVGHQSYVHKILTGRKEAFSTMRQLDGISGFPKTSESKTDCFNTGHSSTSISAAMGMAKARDLSHKDYSVIAVIGDGALTGGMALEALNHVGCTRTKLIIILNDNEMSISKNISGINKLLTGLRSRTIYRRTNSYERREKSGCSSTRTMRSMFSYGISFVRARVRTPTPSSSATMYTGKMKKLKMDGIRMSAIMTHAIMRL